MSPARLAWLRAVEAQDKQITEVRAELGPDHKTHAQRLARKALNGDGE
jgi:hypothetical protein